MSYSNIIKELNTLLGSYDAYYMSLPHDLDFNKINVKFNVVAITDNVYKNMARLEIQVVSNVQNALIVNDTAFNIDKTINKKFITNGRIVRDNPFIIPDIEDDEGRIYTTLQYVINLY